VAAKIKHSFSKNTGFTLFTFEHGFDILYFKGSFKILEFKEEADS
jgi:hypothetical protein